jgi:hypothetical protein
VGGRRRALLLIAGLLTLPEPRYFMTSDGPIDRITSSPLTAA